MKKLALIIMAVLLRTVAFTQESIYQLYTDSVEKTFTYQRGTIELKDGIGKIVVPAGFKYLDPQQAERALVDLWGNPKGDDLTMGFLMPEDQTIMGDTGYVFNIQYEEIGYVKDDDADEINYEDLLKQIQEETEEENKARTKEGYDPISIVGWAASPYYDKDKKILHWAKELKFGTQEVNTLNYNIRVLGRKGVLVLNAIASMPNLPLVKKDIGKVYDIVQFNDGNKYIDFDPSVDQVAAWTIGGLVAGKILAKVGLFAVILKFWKLIALAVVGSATAIWKKIRRKKEEEHTDEEPPAELPELNS